ncbi:hypothetical protein GRI44_06640 [Altererythrobacter confluentis]|uniref:Uncharacterized protein n=1 Tax=Allopontixanthobacter confluentis TaxID=1849021 RepID=A0A6L7GEU5_9SPHN|nr:hypothetical protein [Allopontixanthobacter confluentis]MXP14427.1 hypothetical protein [Allopontixanthobacter confluentis]
MTVHFAAARCTVRSPIARALARRATGFAANDNGDMARQPTSDKMLHAALRHFACHGLGAALEARKLAEAAFAEDDLVGYKWWLGICRTLDGRLAAQLHRATQNQTMIGSGQTAPEFG